MFVHKYLYLCGTFIALHMTLGLSSILMSGIPKEVEPFPGITRNLHVSCLFLYLIYTLHTHSWEMLVSLYALNVKFLSLFQFK